MQIDVGASGMRTQCRPHRAGLLRISINSCCCTAITVKFRALLRLIGNSMWYVQCAVASDFSMYAQVAVETKLEQGRQLQFTEMLFQPMPWSINTKKGMPAEYEQYLDESYVFINVPPNFMCASLAAFCCDGFLYETLVTNMADCSHHVRGTKLPV